MIFEDTSLCENLHLLDIRTVYRDLSINELLEITKLRSQIHEITFFLCDIEELTFFTDSIVYW